MFWGQKWFSHETISHWSFGPNVIDYGRLARRLSVGSLTHFAAIPGIAGRMGDQKCAGGAVGGFLYGFALKLLS